MVRAPRRIGEQITRETRDSIMSVAGSAKTFARAVPGHWGMENSVHWVLDSAFDEDHRRMRKDFSPENFAVLRHMALNLLKLERLFGPRRFLCPSDSLYRRLLPRLSAEHLEWALADWIRATLVAGADEPIALDGKSLRGAATQEQAAVLMSAHPSKNLDKRCLLLFLRSHMTRLSSFLFQFPVPTSRKPRFLQRTRSVRGDVRSLLSPPTLATSPSAPRSSP